jgi:hypothetical protein
MQTRLEANPEEIDKVLEILKRSAPWGALIEQIMEETGYPSYIIYSAIDALKEQGINVQGRNPFEYDPDAVDADTDAHGN